MVKRLENEKNLNEKDIIYMMSKKGWVSPLRHKYANMANFGLVQKSNVFRKNIIFLKKVENFKVLNKKKMENKNKKIQGRTHIKKRRQ